MADDFKDIFRDPPGKAPFDPGNTRTFDANPDILRGQNRDNQAGGRPAGKNPDGTYHYTGKNIPSGRQKLVDPNQPAGNRRRPDREYDDDGLLSVSSNKNKKEKKKNKEELEESKRSGFILSGIIKVILYIVGVLLVSIIIAYNIIMVANDVFAFVKAAEIKEITIPKNADIEKISEILSENGLIKYPKVFNFYLNYKNSKRETPWEFEAGTYPVSSTLNYDEFIAMFRKKAAEREAVRITIQEGFTIDQIIDRLVNEYNIGSKDKFMDVINNTDFSTYGYAFLTPLYETALSPDRKYKLEGYLFPDTYDFYIDESEVNIIIRMLDNFNSKFTEKFYEKAEILKMSIDDIIILASMVEREAKFLDDFPKVAAVFHNRLAYGNVFPHLQSDATKLYDYKEHKSDLTEADLAVDSPYNTYTRVGLPPSAICNPGYEAISAALWPEENFPYFYFIADGNGKVFYNETLAQHERDRNRIRIEKAQAAANAP